MSDAEDALSLWEEVFTLGVELTPQTCEQLLARTARFRETAWLAGAKKEEVNNRLLNVMWTITGDAFHGLKRPTGAAEACRKAATYHTNSCFTDNYVKIVLEHRLAKHYEPARSSMERSLVAMKKYNLRLRFFCHWIVFRKWPRGYFKYVVDKLKRASRLRERDRRIRALASMADSR